MTTQSAIRYRFLVVWLEHSVNPKGHLSWSSGLTAFYFHGATLFSPREQQHDTIRVFSNDAFIALVLTNKTNSGISYPGEKGKEHWKEDFFLVMEYWVRDLTSAMMGPDKMHLWVLRELIDTINRALTIIFGRLWWSGEMPEDWKKANIIPVFQNSKNILIDKFRRCGVDMQTVNWQLAEQQIPEAHNQWHRV